MEQLINITDAVFLGHVGEVELGASALAGIYYLVTYMLGFGFSIGQHLLLQQSLNDRGALPACPEEGIAIFRGVCR